VLAMRQDGDWNSVHRLSDHPAARVVEAEHLSKTFGSFKAVDDLSFSVREGEFIGIIGPNGAGKTTTIHMLLGLITPSAGTIRIFGRSPARDRDYILQKTSFASPYLSFPPRLTVYENLSVFARLYGIRDRAAQVSRYMKVFRIEYLRDKPVARLSSGEATRLALCRALLNRPRLLLLDEPTAFLDAPSALEVKKILLDLQRTSRTTIIYTSHNLLEVEEMCERVMILSRGRMIASGTPVEVTQTILQEERTEPALLEAFLRIG